MAFWQAAYQSHGPVVLAYLRHRVRERDEAEDLLQETFVRAIRADTASGGGSLRGYLLRTARNLLINRARRPRLVVAVGPTPGAEDDADASPLARAADPAASPEQRAAWSAFRAGLARVVAGMTAAHRRAFELGVVQRLSYAEIASRTGWTPAQVKTNVFRARQRVIAALGDQLPVAPGSPS
jgi:RNA polymerase sigma-70 factor (ECF subfamily)